MEFKFNEMFPLGTDKTEYHLLTDKYVLTSLFEGEEILKVDKEGLRMLSGQAMHDIAFMLRPEHNEQVSRILSDPQASVNDRVVALIMLLNADISSKGVLPFCQDTKALLNPATLEKYLAEKMKLFGTSACPPYHIAFVISGTSAEQCMKTVKLASAKYLDELPKIGSRRVTLSGILSWRQSCSRLPTLWG